MDSVVWNFLLAGVQVGSGISSGWDQGDAIHRIVVGAQRRKRLGRAANAMYVAATGSARGLAVSQVASMLARFVHLDCLGCLAEVSLADDALVFAPAEAGGDADAARSILCSGSHVGTLQPLAFALRGRFGQAPHDHAVAGRTAEWIDRARGRSVQVALRTTAPDLPHRRTPHV